VERFASDRRLSVLAGVLAAIIAANYLFTLSRLPFYQVSPEFLGPAVMIASGRGFVTPVADAIPPLVDFLVQRTQEFNPEDLPASFPTLPNSNAIRTHCYLLYTTGVLWRVFGIHWHTLKLLSLILFTASGMILYRVFRLGMSRPFSIAGTVLFLASPIMVTALNSVRDFGKAPFILAVLWIVGRLALRPIRGWGLMGMAAALGLLTGIGQGFRQDVLACVLPALGAVLFLAHGTPRLQLRARIAAPFVLLASFAVTAWPTLSPPETEGSLLYHQIMMGLSTESTDRMGLGHASYEFQSVCNDNMAHAIRNDYARRVKGNTAIVGYQNREGMLAAQGYLLDLFRRFPADIITRGYGAILTLLGGVTAERTTFAPEETAFITRLGQLHQPIEDHFRGYGLFYAVAAVLLVSLWNFRSALCLLALILFFGGYTAVQFQYRHCFHLAFAPIWCFGFLLDKAVCGGVSGFLAMRRRSLRTRLQELRVVGWHPLIRTVAFAVSAAAILLAPLYAAQSYQDRQVDGIISVYPDAPLTALETDAVETNGMILRRLKGTQDLADENLASNPPDEDQARWLADPASLGKWNPHDMDVRADYLVAQFDGVRGPFPLEVRYRAEQPGNNFTHTFCVRAAPGSSDQSVRFFFPVYEFPDSKTVGRSRFEGIVLRQDDAPLFRGLYRVSDLSNFPFLLPLTLPADRTLFRSHQTLRWGEIAALLGDPFLPSNTLRTSFRIKGRP
jgi:hypothetical protein